MPLYITKVEEKSLKYGWEHREFLNYGDVLNLAGRARNGMVEFHSTERSNPANNVTVDNVMDIVNSDLFERCSWSYQHDVVPKGCSSNIQVDIDDPISMGAMRIDSNTWRVTVHSASHGLIDGAMVTVSGIMSGTVRGIPVDFNTGMTPVTVVDGDTITYDIHCDPSIVGTVCHTGNAVIKTISIADNGLDIVFRFPVYGIAPEDRVYVNGCNIDGDAFPNGPYTVVSVSPDNSTICVGVHPSSVPVPGSTASVEKPLSDAKIVYIQDHYARIASISLDSDGNLSIIFADKVHGASVGDKVYVEGCTVAGHDFPPGPYEVVEVNNDHTGLTVSIGGHELPVPGDNAIVRKPIEENDVVAITDDNDVPVKFYEVSTGIWSEVERNSIVAPFELFSQTNMFDVSVTNPVIAMGDPINIREIIYTGDGIATVHLESPIRHFINENRRYIEGKTVVRIDNVNPSDFNGYHVVKEVFGPTSFSISMRLFNEYGYVGTPVGDLTMTLRECRWYRYTVDEIEWDKVSSQATFTGKNVTTLVDETDGRVKLICKCEHGLSVGDHAVLGYSFDRYDETTGLAGFAMGRVVEVLDGMNVILEIEYGDYEDGMSIARGIISLDNLSNRYDEYAIRLESLDNEMYRFHDGDIVIAAGQIVPAENLAYLVRSDARWTVLKRKRIVKIRHITVDEYRNSEYIDADVEEGLDEYKYTTYSDVDVAKASGWAYASRMYMTRNPVFDKPAIEGIDTTRNPNAEYSSGEDYANVAPRTDMKPSFKGVPDLKYPLIEKIERLAYLRDANVIDFELIGYLARFMGYDLTPMADDVSGSNLYRTVKEQEAAIREAVLNLPQYYSLGGTNAGLKMLMGAFGVIGDVLTLYTNTMYPYEEMLNKEEVAGRLEDDTMNGTLEGSWVSTPYIDIALTDDSRFPQFAIQQDDIKRIREQIRVWKPIQVVFRDILLRYVGEMEMNTWIEGPIVGIGEFGMAIEAGDTDEVVEPDYPDPELTNCAF
jgi:hypothetical protein